MHDTSFKVDRCMLMKEFDTGRVWRMLSGQLHEKDIEKTPKQFYFKITEWQ